MFLDDFLVRSNTYDLQKKQRVFRTSTGSHGGTVGAWSDGDSLLILLAIYIQSVHTKRFIRNLYATLPSLFVPSVPPWYCLYLRPLRSSVCLIYISVLVYHSIFRMSQKNL